jgi:hypothetical protein
MVAAITTLLGRLGVAAGLAVCGACGDNLAPGSPVTVHAAPDRSIGTGMAIADLVADLAHITGDGVDEASVPAPPCRAGEVHIAVLGPAQPDDDGALPALSAQEYWIDEARCGNGRRVVVRGGSELATQWAIYELLDRLGVRYFHPERTLYPPQLTWPDQPLAVRAAPAFRRRSMHVHTTHPVELSPPLDSAGIDMAGYQRRWIDWNVKQRQTLVDGWSPELVGTHAHDRGFPRGVSLNLLNSQQGRRPVIDPDDPRPERVQIAEALDELMATVPGSPPPRHLSFQFNPSEFTVADEQRTVDRLTFVTEHVTSRWPDVDLWTINHGTAQPPGDVFGIRFFDLPERAPPALGVEVHPLMLYDLHRPAAGVYGNPDFRHLFTWLVAQQEVRRITYYPESSWWLTFDLPVPLYLAPATIEARDHDIQRLRPYLAAGDDAPTGVYGHHLFTSGQEWGYWMIDYCTARMAWDAGPGWAGCIDHVAGSFAGGAELGAVLREVARRQVDDVRDPDVLRMLVGSDDETEAAARAGVVLHPLPPLPADVLDWDDATVAAFAARSLDPLAGMASAYEGWAARVEALLPMQSDDQAPWVREVRDGLQIMALRARHADVVYRTAIALRDAIGAGDVAAAERAATGVDQAAAITTAAAAIVAAREQDYRYVPALQTDGDEPGTRGAVPNRTIYPYRVLSRTHRLHAWRRPDGQLAAMFGEGLDLVTVSDRVLLEGTPLAITVIADRLSMVTVGWGDGVVVDTLAPHTYRAQGVYGWSLDAVHAGGVIQHRDVAAVVARRLRFPASGLSVVAPDGAEIVENLLPGFEIGLGTDGAGDFLVIGRLDGPATVSAQGSIARRPRDGAVSGPLDLPVELDGVGSLTIHAAVVTVTGGIGPDQRGLEVQGELATDELVARLVDVGGFDERGARELIAGILGYTVDTLPARVPFTVTGAGTEPG